MEADSLLKMKGPLGHVLIMFPGFSQIRLGVHVLVGIDQRFPNMQRAMDHVPLGVSIIQIPTDTDHDFIGVLGCAFWGFGGFFCLFRRHGTTARHQKQGQ